MKVTSASQQVSSVPQLTEMPCVGYSKHPAFCILGVAPTVLSDEVWRGLEEANERLATIDNALDQAPSPSSSGLREIAAMNRDLRARSGKPIREFSGELLKARNDWTEWELSILPKYFHWLTREYRRYLRYQRWRIRHLGKMALHHDDKIGAMARDLKSLGAIPMQIDPASKAALLAEANPVVLQLREQDARRPNYLAATGVGPTHRRFWKRLRAAIKHLDLGQVAGSYLGYPVQLTSVGLAVNSPGNRYFSDRYADVGLSPARASGMHFDSGCGMIKAMFYLSDVAEGDGAFSYVLGSNSWSLPHFRRFSGQALPYSGIVLDNPQSRRLFLKLPESLQQLSHFGSDFPDDDQNESSVLANERTYTSETGDVVLFDNRGLHRGGVLPKRERIALQLQFSPWSERVSEIASKWLVDRRLGT